MLSFFRWKTNFRDEIERSPADQVISGDGLTVSGWRRASGMVTVFEWDDGQKLRWWSKRSFSRHITGDLEPDDVWVTLFSGSQLHRPSVFAALSGKTWRKTLVAPGFPNFPPWILEHIEISPPASVARVPVEDVKIVSDGTRVGALSWRRETLREVIVIPARPRRHQFKGAAAIPQDAITYVQRFHQDSLQTFWVVKSDQILDMGRSVNTQPERYSNDGA